MQLMVRGTSGRWVIPVNKDVSMAEWIAFSGCVEYSWLTWTTDLVWLILSDRKWSLFLKVILDFFNSLFLIVTFISNVCNYKYIKFSRYGNILDLFNSRMLFHFYLETREMYWIDSHLMCGINKRENRWCGSGLKLLFVSINIRKYFFAVIPLEGRIWS